ncbi:MAG: NADH:flavin oxidoreductase/nadh oxidase [Myxococcales bacterium]|nr:NADH:flavin oxidoreductase/nadh oxidase [Myxococcales bacterium]
MRAFREAVEAKDLAKATALLAPDVVFNSPVSFKPYHGREQVGWILATVATVFEDFEYVDELETGLHSALRFRARIGDRTAEGIDLIERDADGAIRSLTVMLRPLSALQALGEAMAARFGKAPPR